MRDRPLKSIGLGVLGFAHGHVNAYCDRWRSDHSAELKIVAGWDHDRERMQAAAEKHGCVTCPTAIGLLERDDIEAVVIASETSMHAELTEAAATAGKSVILQKPVALTLADADRIIEAVDRHSIPFTLAWQMRTDEQNLKIKEILESGILGRIFMIRRRHGLSTHMWGWFADSWHVKPELNRGMWADDAAHAVDFLLWLAGEPVSVTAEIGTLLNPKVPDDNGIAIFRYDDGMFAEVVSSFTCVAGENTTEIIGEKGVLIQNFGDAPSANVPRPEGGIALKWFLHETGQWEVSPLQAPANHGARIAALAGPLLEYIQGKRAPLATAEEGRTALQMILASYESAESGRRVTL